MNNSTSPELRPISPTSIRIAGVRPIPRTFHRDSRGFLVETLRSDDTEVDGASFQMTYSSVTLPGKFRDGDRWHVHRAQTDRFVVVLGEMVLALFDDRQDSATRDRLEVVRLTGIAQGALLDSSTGDYVSYLVPIPPGVLHCIGNLGTEPFLLQNFPTKLYNLSDEGRVPFTSKPIEELGGPFAWDLVERSTDLL